MGQMKRWYPAPTFMLWLPSCHDRASRPSTIVSQDRKSTRLNSSHMSISYAVFCLKKKIIGGDGQFASGAFQMIDENFEIIRLNEGVLGRISEKIVWLTHDELIERRRRSNENADGSATA